MITVGENQPNWIKNGVFEYVRRFPKQWAFKHEELCVQKRKKRSNLISVIEAESESILTNIRSEEYLVILDIKGNSLSTQGLAKRLNKWHLSGKDICFVIGGPDGLSKDLLNKADYLWSLSELTLPHGLARIFC